MIKFCIEAVRGSHASMWGRTPTLNPPPPSAETLSSLTCGGLCHRTTERQQARPPAGPSGRLPDPSAAAGDEEGSRKEPSADPEKDDMMARRTGSHHSRAGQGANQFLPVPGSVRFGVAPVSAMKPLSGGLRGAQPAASSGRCVGLTEWSRWFAVVPRRCDDDDDVSRREADAWSSFTVDHSCDCCLFGF